MESFGRYEAPDDFGYADDIQPLLVLAFDALSRIGRTGQARDIFETLLARRNPVGLLSEDIDPPTGDVEKFSANLLDGWNHQWRGAFVRALGLGGLGTPVAA